MKRVLYSFAAILFSINILAHITGLCTGAGASQPIDAAIPCNCIDAQCGSSWNKSNFSTQAVADVPINNFLTTQSKYGQPTIPLAWQDVRASNMLLNGTGIIKHEFSNEFITGPTTFSVAAINICQVKNSCNAFCQG